MSIKIAGGQPQPHLTAGGNMQADESLNEWLSEQVATLARLESEAKSLKVDFVKNAREKGLVLVEVQRRLRGLSGAFKSWVSERAGIGYSTAQLYIDVAKNFKSIAKRFDNSNVLETTLCQFRDAIRDSRQKEGKGKVGSGKKKKADDDDDKLPTTGSALTVANSNRWEREVAIAEAEAEAVNGEEDDTVVPEQRLYKIGVTVSDSLELKAIFKSLKLWTPTEEGDSAQLAIPVGDIGVLFSDLGKTLQQVRPVSVKVCVES